MKFDPTTGEFIPDDTSADGNKGRKAGKSEQSSGCGCLILLLIVVGVISAVVQQKKKARQAAPTANVPSAPWTPPPPPRGPPAFSTPAVTVAHNVISNGAMGLEASFNVSCTNGDGRTIVPTLYFKNASGADLRDYDGMYADRAGLAAVWHEVATGTGDYWATTDTLFFPYGQLHLANGAHEIVAEVVFYDSDKTTVLARSAGVGMRINWP